MLFCKFETFGLHDLELVIPMPELSLAARSAIHAIYCDAGGWKIQCKQDSTSETQYFHALADGLDLF